MAGEWIKMRTGLRKHPKAVAMARYLSGQPDFVNLCFGNRHVTSHETVTHNVTFEVVTRVTVCALLEVWGAINSVLKEEECISFMALSDIDDIAGIPCFGKAMAYVGWVVESAGEGLPGLEFPNFTEFNTPDSKRRVAKSDAQRAKEYRERKKQQTTPENVTDRHASSRGEEKSREEDISNVDTLDLGRNASKNSEQTEKPVRPKKPKPEQPGMDFSQWPNAPSPAVWADYEKLRKAKRAAVSQTVVNTIGKAMAELENYGVGVDQALAVACSQGWQGFESQWVLRYLNKLPVQDSPGRHGVTVTGGVTNGVTGGRATRERTLADDLTDRSWAESV